MRKRLAGALGAIGFFLGFATLVQAQPGRTNGNSGFTAQAPVVTQPGHREWTWQGDHSLSYAGSGHVRYQPEGTPRIIVTGDPAEVENIEVDGGTIRRNDSRGFNFGRGGSDLDILVRGVTLDRFNLAGSATLDLGQLHRDSLDLRIYGSGTVNAQGEVKNLRVEVDGSGRANLDQFSAAEADINATGSGNIVLQTVTRTVKLRVTGSGTVTMGGAEDVGAKLTGSGTVRLTSPPSHADYKILGSGKVVLIGPDGKVSLLARMNRDRDRDRGSPPVPPAPPAPPAPSAPPR